MSPPPPLASAQAMDDLTIIEPLCAVFRRTLKDAGLKYTPERAHILDAIVRHDGLFEADQLTAAVRTAGLRVSKATVYRTIKLLVDAGIIQRVPFDDEPARYQLVYGRPQPDLLVRIDTGRIQPVNAPELAAIARRLCELSGLELRGHRFLIYAAQPGAGPPPPVKTNEPRHPRHQYPALPTWPPDRATGS